MNSKNKKKKIIIIIISVILILFGIYMLYNTFAVSTIASNNEDNIYDIIAGEGTTITVPKSSSKTIYFHIKNTNGTAVKYALGYNTGANIEVKVYEDSKDKTSDIISYGDNKYIKLYLNNTTTTANTVTIKSILGYENGGDLIIPNGITLVTEVYTPPKVATLADYITNLYTNASKSTVTNNSITYNYASSESLMNDRLGGTTSSLDGGNIRYYGANPNNYIYFNCETYPDTNCELWRIIGVFDGKVKIMRNENIGKYSWDNKDTDTGAEESTGQNDWSTARLMKLLNPSTYYKTDTNDNGNGKSLYWNAKSGTCFSGPNNATTTCDFTSTGIKNDTTKYKISEVTWNLGGWNNSNIYTNQIYAYERGTTVYSGRSTTWTGKIALPYPSDYGYAADFNSCSSILISYDDSTCTSNNWMWTIINEIGWLLTPRSDRASGALATWNGAVYNNAYDVNNTDASSVVFPTLYLSSDESIVDGTTGSQNNPYKLNP